LNVQLYAIEVLNRSAFAFARKRVEQNRVSCVRAKLLDDGDGFNEGQITHRE
jgi:hypothetical protein